jgi:hypothetical protein
VHLAAKLVKRSSSGDDTRHAIAEINAYIAIRDALLAEAEQMRTRAKLDSVIVANDYVETCLQPARAPYQAQFLPEAAAIRERKRCALVKTRIAELREQAPRQHAA